MTVPYNFLVCSSNFSFDTIDFSTSCESFILRSFTRNLKFFSLISYWWRFEVSASSFWTKATLCLQISLAFFEWASWQSFECWDIVKRFKVEDYEMKKINLLIRFISRSQSYEEKLSILNPTIQWKLKFAIKIFQFQLRICI